MIFYTVWDNFAFFESRFERDTYSQLPRIHGFFFTKKESFVHSAIKTMKAYTCITVDLNRIRTSTLHIKSYYRTENVKRNIKQDTKIKVMK
jgi:hypothetical protein